MLLILALNTAHGAPPTTVLPTNVCDATVVVAAVDCPTQEDNSSEEWLWGDGPDGATCAWAPANALRGAMWFLGTGDTATFAEWSCTIPSLVDCVVPRITIEVGAALPENVLATVRDAQGQCPS